MSSKSIRVPLKVNLAKFVGCFKVFRFPSVIEFDQMPHFQKLLQWHTTIHRKVRHDLLSLIRFVLARCHHLSYPDLPSACAAVSWILPCWHAHMNQPWVSLHCHCVFGLNSPHQITRLGAKVWEVKLQYLPQLTKHITYWCSRPLNGAPRARQVGHFTPGRYCSTCFTT